MVDVELVELDDFRPRAGDEEHGNAVAGELDHSRLKNETRRPPAAVETSPSTTTPTSGPAPGRRRSSNRQRKVGPKLSSGARRATPGTSRRRGRSRRSPSTTPVTKRPRATMKAASRSITGWATSQETRSQGRRRASRRCSDGRRGEARPAAPRANLGDARDGRAVMRQVTHAAPIACVPLDSRVSKRYAGRVSEPETIRPPRAGARQIPANHVRREDRTAPKYRVKGLPLRPSDELPRDRASARPDRERAEGSAGPRRADRRGARARGDRARDRRRGRRRGDRQGATRRRARGARRELRARTRA